ncbi:MAG: hypothetical protein ABFS17_12850 [Chloroflexota bacterium]
MNESNQGQFAALLIFISVLFVLGSLLTAFAEAGFPDADPGAIQATDYIFSSPTPVSSATPTMFQTTAGAPVPSATIDSGIDAGAPNEASATPVP